MAANDNRVAGKDNQCQAALADLWITKETHQTYEANKHNKHIKQSQKIKHYVFSFNK
jgi:hypothetical protein